MSPILDFKSFCIAADDWGFSPAVNRGILELCELGVIRKVSLMATEPFLKNQLNELVRLKDVSLGLHFNLTYSENSHREKLFKFSSPGDFLKFWVFSSSKTKQKLKEWVRAEAESQLSLLQAANVPLRHFDGHHHIHIVPGLFDVISDILKKYQIQEVRVPYDPQLWLSSKMPINFFSKNLAASKNLKDFQANSRFRYPSASIFESSQKLGKYLLASKGAEVLTHPASEDDFQKYGIQDPISYSRVLEYRALKELATSWDF